MKLTPKKILSNYLSRLRSIYATGLGTDETSYYPAFDELVRSVGDLLNPKIKSLSQLANKGAGLPDFGWLNSENEDLFGIVEAKPIDQDLVSVSLSPQGQKYLAKYGVVLVTNYRSFQLVTGDKSQTNFEESYTLCESGEAVFSKNSFTDKADDLVKFFRSVLLRKAPIRTPQELAERLAHYAQRAKEMLAVHSIEDLQPLKDTMRSALGVEFSDEEGEAFFRSSLIQTIFYGLFSGWIIWLQEKPRKSGDYFRFKDVEDYLHLRVINALFTEITKPYHLKKLNLRPAIEWAEGALNRVDQFEFFKTFEDRRAIQYFYEPFLAEFDQQLRKQFGVWYTPPEVVEYMVNRVDYFLREKLGLSLGLADENVVLLDPCCGTGSYLIEAIKIIHQRLTETSGELASNKLRKAVKERVIGFELLTAPFVIAHLQLGLLLSKLKAPLGEDDRAAVYLTNALTGWQPRDKTKQEAFAFTEFRDERDAADKVKQGAKILVVIGNPPYDRYAGVSEEEEGDFIQPYKRGLHDRFGIRKQLLDDQYIRFFRLGERVIAEHSGKGIVCYISNSSWLNGESHPLMREHLVQSFNEIWIDNLRGSGAFSGSRGPDGLPDRNVFEHSLGSIGIKVGVAVTTLVKSSTDSNMAKTFHRDFWGQGWQKREALKTRGKEGDFVKGYEAIIPSLDLAWKLSPQKVDSQYSAWKSLPKIFPTYFSGVNTNRGDSITHIDPDVLVRRMKVYYDKNKSDEEVEKVCPDIMNPVARYNPKKVRENLLSKKSFDEKNVVVFAFKPLDQWFLYYENEGKLINEKRPQYFEQVWQGNQFFLTYKKSNHMKIQDQLYVTPQLAELQVTYNSSPFPLFIRRHEHGKYVYLPNIDKELLKELCKQWNVPYEVEAYSLCSKPESFELVEEIFYHAIAILQSPAYRKENADQLRQNWPRIPIPKNRKLLKHSADLGRQVASLHQPDVEVEGVTKFPFRSELKNLAVPSKVGSMALDLTVTVRFGAKGKWIESETKGKQAPTGDLYWNDTCFWKNVPKAVYEFTIGGYPVVKKWLSYRHIDKLKRPLTEKEIEYVSEMVRRIAALVALNSELDDNYQSNK